VLNCERRACRVNRRVPSSTWVPGFVLDAAPWLEWTWGADGFPVQLTLEEAKWALPAMLEDMISWTKSGHGHVGVQAVEPPGTGKTKEAIDRMVRAGCGSLLVPNHKLRNETVKRFKAAGGGDCVEFEGVIRQLRKMSPERARMAEAFQALGYSASALIDDDDRPRAAVGAGCVAFATHHHLRHVPVKDSDSTSTRLYGRRRTKKKSLWTPVILDELPPLRDCWQLEPSSLELLTSRSQLSDLDRWLGERNAAAAVVVQALAILRLRRKNLPADQLAYAERISGKELQELLLEAAGGRHALRAAVAATPHLAARVLLPPPKPDAIFQATPIYPWPDYAPSPAPSLVQSGEVQARSWPHRLTDFFHTSLFAEATCTRLAPVHRHTACLVVSGRGDRACAWGELRRPWSLDVPRHLSVIVADATATYVEESFEAAWPGRKVRYFRAEVLPAEPRATKRVWLKTSKTSYSRRLLLRRSATPGTGAEVKPSAIPALIRLLLMAVEQMQRHLGDGRTLAIIAPKPVVSLIEVSMPAEKPGAASLGEDALPSVKPELRLQATLHDLTTSGRLGGLVTAHQGATSGTNDLEASDALLTMPFTPNLGDVFEDARALDVDPEGHLDGLRNVELVQASHRLRPLRATMDSPKLLLHIGALDPPDWPLDVEVVAMPAGGPVPTSGTSAARVLAEQLMVRHRAVSAALIRLIAADPEWYTRAAGLTAEEAVGAVSLARCALTLSKRSLERAVKKATPTAWLVRPSSPLRGGGRWPMREIEVSAAAVLVHRLVETREVSDASGLV